MKPEQVYASNINTHAAIERLKLAAARIAKLARGVERLQAAKASQRKFGRARSRAA